MENLKSEIQGLNAFEIPELWRTDGSPVSEAKFLKDLQRIIQSTNNVDALLVSFDETNLIRFFDSLTNGGNHIQQLLRKHAHLSYEILNNVALAHSRLKDFSGVPADWSKVQQLLSIQN